MRNRNATHALMLSAALCLGTIWMPATASGSRDAGQTDPPAPTVRNAPRGQHGFPFMSSALNLASRGYVEQEFLISGVARAFIPASNLQSDGRWNVRPNPGVIAPYVTRILVRRPASADRFNGKVLVEWFNESAGFDTASDWLYVHQELVREGYAYVGVTAQFVGVQGLQGWESGPSARYASLFHPGESFAYDIFAQAGWVLNHAHGADPRPLGNLTEKVRTLLATGFSQSAAFLTTYANAVHRLSPVYDGFLIHDTGFGSPLSIDSASFNGDPVPVNVPATPFIDVPYPSNLRSDLQVPTLILLSEFGLSDDGTGAARTFHLQHDSGQVRIWELAGATHLEDGWLQEFAADAGKTFPGFALDTCEGPPGIPSLVHGRGERAAVNVLSHWVSSSEPPRAAARISLNVPDPPSSFDQLVTFNRDPATNLVKSGIRLPNVSVPTATLNGNRDELDATVLGPATQCPLVGSYDPWNHDSDRWDRQPGLDPSPFPEPVLQSLYPTHLNYVERVTRATLQALGSGYVRPADGVEIVLDAAHAPVP